MTDPFTRKLALARVQNIPDMGAYAAEWLRLGDEFEALGCMANAADCHKRAESYGELSGTYVRLFVGASIAELLEA